MNLLPVLILLLLELVKLGLGDLGLLKGSGLGGLQVLLALFLLAPVILFLLLLHLGNSVVGGLGGLALLDHLLLLLLLALLPALLPALLTLLLALFSLHSTLVALLLSLLSLLLALLLALLLLLLLLLLLSLLTNLLLLLPLSALLLTPPRKERKKKKKFDPWNVTRKEKEYVPQNQTWLKGKLGGVSGSSLP